MSLNNPLKREVIYLNFMEATAVIVKSALENKAISLQTYSYDDTSETAAQNEFNKQQIINFITGIAETLKSLDN